MLQMKNKRTGYCLGKPLIVLVLLLICNSFAHAVFAQTSEGAAQITVRVTDPQGATLPNAEVTLYTRDSRIRISSLTDSNGISRFDQLAPGEYLLEAQAGGFARAAARVLHLEKGGNASLDI